MVRYLREDSEDSGTVIRVNSVRFLYRQKEQCTWDKYGNEDSGTYDLSCVCDRIDTKYLEDVAMDNADYEDLPVISIKCIDYNDRVGISNNESDFEVIADFEIILSENISSQEEARKIAESVFVGIESPNYININVSVYTKHYPATYWDTEDWDEEETELDFDFICESVGSVTII